MSDEIISKVLAYGDRHGLLLPGRHILVACSGGADSLALLDILLQLRTLRQLTITPRISSMAFAARTPVMMLPLCGSFAAIRHCLLGEVRRCACLCRSRRTFP
mgnify:CR=1 FL=1